MMENFTGGVPVTRWWKSEADTFAPIQSHVEFMEKVVDIHYKSDHAEAKWSGEAEVKKVGLNGRTFDYEELCSWCAVCHWRLATKLACLFWLETVGVFWEVEVSGLETVTVPAGTFECFKLKPSHGQTYWYSTDPHRYPVKYEAGDGVAELSAVRQSNQIVLQPAPWQDGEEMQLDVKAAGRAVGTFVYAVRAATDQRAEYLAPDGRL